MKHLKYTRPQEVLSIKISCARLSEVLLFKSRTRLDFALHNPKRAPGSASTRTHTTSGSVMARQKELFCIPAGGVQLRKRRKSIRTLIIMKINKNTLDHTYGGENEEISGSGRQDGIHTN